MRRIRLETIDRQDPRALRRMLANFADDRWGFSVVALTILSLLSLFIAIQSIAITSERIVSGNMALLASRTCGYWAPQASGVNSGIYRGPFLENEAWNDAERYARTCYIQKEVGGLCNRFARQKIDFTVLRNTACPFAIDCCVGPNSALEIDTGLRDIRELGINSNIHNYFRFRVVSVPLINGPERLTRKWQYDENSYWMESYGTYPEESYRTVNLTRFESCESPTYIIK